MYPTESEGPDIVTGGERGQWHKPVINTILFDIDTQIDIGIVLIGVITCAYGFKIVDISQSCHLAILPLQPRFRPWPLIIPGPFPGQGHCTLHVAIGQIDPTWLSIGVTVPCVLLPFILVRCHNNRIVGVVLVLEQTETVEEGDGVVVGVA